jgi:very-short-patch-repair endonuclease
MSVWAQLAALAATQHGLVATWQAAELGVTRQRLAYRAEEHGWKRVRPGVFLLPGHGLPPVAILKAAELAFRTDGIATGRAAAFVWELIPRLHRPLEFMVLPGCSRRPQGTSVRECRWLADNEPILRRNLWVPSVEWTICSCGHRVPVPQLKRMISLADRKRLCPQSGVRAAVEANPTFKGRRFVRQALRELAGEGLSHSELEKLGRRRLRAAGLTPHRRPHTVEHGGRFVGEIDIAFLDELVGVPIDGPHHFEADQKRADDDQRHKLTLLGWLLVPADEHRLVHEPEVFIRQVRAALDARRTRPVSGFPSTAV